MASVLEAYMALNLTALLEWVTALLECLDLFNCLMLALFQYYIQTILALHCKQYTQLFLELNQLFQNIP